MTLTLTEAIARYELFVANPEQHICDYAHVDRLPCECTSIKFFDISVTRRFVRSQIAVKESIRTAWAMTIDRVINPTYKAELIDALTEHIRLLKALEE